ncbi:ectin-like [Hydractinia symbiolongicarpus]|uniref:ectin-like n=1 Tax=Hydractinia symbiolongicarpus TaxID=13093 RepID=UPI0025518BE9|nr:ectin-like [Hydractinia symbiolongicarpus]
MVIYMLAFFLLLEGARGEVIPVNQEECIRVNNVLRNLHNGTKPVTWSSTLATHAQEWANHLALVGNLQHAKNINEGENLYWTSGTGTCADATLSWYDEYKDYDYSTTKSAGGAIGHFTQVVWKPTTHIGVGIAKSSSGTYIVARYSPQGNFVMINYGEDYTTARLRVYTKEVAQRTEGAKTPSIYELIPSRCVDGLDGRCVDYKSYFSCDHSYVKFHCPLLCKQCSVASG